jgi:hypothetical protein
METKYVLPLVQDLSVLTIATKDMGLHLILKPVVLGVETKDFSEHCADGTET